MIDVHLEYRDEKRHILRGLYADDAPELHGLVDHLLRAGHAVYIHDATDVTADESVSITDAEIAEWRAETPKQEDTPTRRNRKR